MSKQELIKLRERLLKSNRYYLVDITDVKDDKIQIEVFENFTTLGANVKLYDDEEAEEAVNYLESSCEKLIRKLADKEIAYDELEIKIVPLFYLNERVVKKVNEESYLDSNDLTIDDLINDKLKVVFDYNFKEDEKNISLPKEILKEMDNIVDQIFLVDYNTFAEILFEEGYEIKYLSFKKLLEAKKQGENIKISIKFPKAKKISKNSQ